jgi:MFS transporter, DHA1 family, inner membrane transport protein
VSAAATTAGARVALGTLGLAAFVLGTAEFVIVGVLDLVARDLGVSIAVAGRLVMAYALGISIGGPLVAALTARLDRRRVLVAALLVFVGANLVMAFSTSQALLLAARFVSGAMHGLFVGIASIVATALVPVQQRGRAISLVFGGIALATVLGVPAGTYVAQFMGWRACFQVIAALSLVNACAMVALLPRETGSRGAGFLTLAGQAFAPAVLAMLVVAMLVVGGQFSAFTYMAAFLKEITGASADAIGLYLLAYGVAGALGMFIGGWLADQDAARTLIAANVALLPILAVLYWLGKSALVAACALAAWGFVSFALVPSLQLRVVSLAHCGADLAATLSASAVNLGIAGGSFIGGWALTAYGLESVVLVGLALCMVALPATIASRVFGAHAAQAPVT